MFPPNNLGEIIELIAKNGFKELTTMKPHEEILRRQKPMFTYMAYGREMAAAQGGGWQ